MHELMGLGHSWAFLYFFTYLILAQFIMLNLVVAVLLINYGTHTAMHALLFESRRPPARHAQYQSANSVPYHTTTPVHLPVRVPMRNRMLDVGLLLT